MKNIRIFHLKIFLIFGCKIFNIFEYACFRNGTTGSRPRDEWRPLPQCLSEGLRPTITVCGRAYHGPACGFHLE